LQQIISTYESRETVFGSIVKNSRTLTILSLKMYSKALVAATFTTLAVAAPISQAKKPYIAVSLFFHIHPPNHFAFEEPAPTELYHFYNYHQAMDVVKLNFEHDYAFGVDINAVECQAYADALGQVPLGSFTNTQPLIFDTPTTVGSGLCYARAD